MMVGVGLLSHCALRARLIRSCELFLRIIGYHAILHRFDVPPRGHISHAAGVARTKSVDSAVGHTAILRKPALLADTTLRSAFYEGVSIDTSVCELECEVVISDEVYQTAGLPHEGVQLKEITVRGRAAPIVVRTVLKAENLATLFERAKANSVAAA
jgi:hypothetical protein